MAVLVDVDEEAQKSRWVGQDAAEIVIEYLNQPGLSLDDPIVLLIKDTHAYEAGQIWKGQEIVSRINDAIQELRIGVAEVHGFDASGFTVKEVPTGDPTKTGLWFAFTRAIYLHKSKLLGRIRQCAKPDCNQWFFAVLPGQMFHTLQCRKETTANSPEFKERRKQYMRRRRKKLKKKK